MNLGLEGRACVVTGASLGIGLETARMLCAEGASVLLVARGEDALRDAAEQCAAAGGRAEWLAVDVTAPAAAEQVVEECERLFGALDVLVNNAGTSAVRPFDELSDEDWDIQWQLDVMAPMRLMRAAAPGMAQRGWGRIVNVASSSGKRPSRTNLAYAVGKAAELSLSRGFADRYAGTGVRVNALAPGPVESPLWMGEGGLADQLAKRRGRVARRGARHPARPRADRALRAIRGDRLCGRVPLLRARLVCDRRGMVGGWGHRPGDHLGPVSGVGCRVSGLSSARGFDSVHASGAPLGPATLASWWTPAGVEVVVPERMALEHVPPFVEEKRPWIERTLRRLREAEAALPAARLDDGGVVPYLGLSWSWGSTWSRPRARPRGAPRRRAPRPRGSGGRDAVRGALERWYRRRARVEVAAAAGRRHAPRRHVLHAAADPRPAHPLGQLLLERRDELQLATAAGARRQILDYVVEHEVAHLEVLDHSPRFWRCSPRAAPITASTSAGCG